MEVHKRAVLKTYIIGEVLVMVSRELKETMLEVVDNQLNDNDPKCTTDTFERLVASGYSPQEAKKRIAEVLLDRMTASLATGKAFDEADFGKRLDRIEGKGEQRPATIEPLKHTIVEIVDCIKYDPKRDFPEEELEEIIANQEEAIPLLLDVLKDVREDKEKYITNVDYFGHIYAVYLLAQFRAMEAYPLVLELFSLPNEQPDQLFGDMMDSSGRILASICGGDVASIKQMIENEEIDEYIRAQAITALAILTLNGEFERQELMAYYKELFRTIDNMTILTLLINLCTEIYPEELYEEIKEAYKNDKVDYLMIGMESVDQAMMEGKSTVLARAKRNSHLQKIDDTIGELRNWAYFKKYGKNAEDKYFDQLMNKNPGFMSKPKGTPIVNEPKIGRNDPCPCGSGKKYKKCCGK